MMILSLELPAAQSLPMQCILLTKYVQPPVGYGSERIAHVAAALHLQLCGVAPKRMLRWTSSVSISKASLIHPFDKLVRVGRSKKCQTSLWPSFLSVSI